MDIPTYVSPSPNEVRITEVGEIAANYQAFVVDVWGVICDGTRQYPRAVDALRKLRSIGPVALLSNTARRSKALCVFLDDLGIDESCYDVVITAGELCHGALCSPKWLSPTNVGKDVWYLGPDRDRGILNGTGLKGHGVPEDACALLCTGLAPGLADVLSHTEKLNRGIACGLPFLCANPDREVMIGLQKVPCAGALADLYQELGGTVVHFGKPETETYNSCLTELQRINPEIHSSKVLAIGDGMATDILGAFRFGLPSLLIEGEGGDESRLNALSLRELVKPTFRCQDLKW